MYSPADLRGLLSDPVLNTPSMSTAVDRIGVMPNLRTIVQREHAKRRRWWRRLQPSLPDLSSKKGAAVARGTSSRLRA
jgi:hypothetical protein